MARTFTAKVNLPSYDDMFKPLAAYKEAYDKAEAEYALLEANTEILERSLDPNSRSYQRYKEYADSLSDTVSDFSRGMTYKNRGALLGFKRGYARDIVPISNAIKRKSELIAEQRKAMEADPTRRYERYADDISIDELVDDPNTSYGRGYSGALFAQQTGQAAAALKSMLTPGKIEKLGLPYQYTRMVHHGATPDQVFTAIMDQAYNGDDNMIRMLNGIVDNVMAANGVTPKSSVYSEMRQFANMGLWSSVGDTELKDYKDDFGASAALKAIDHRNNVAMENLRHRHSLEQAAYQAKLAGLDPEGGDMNFSTTNFWDVSGDEARYIEALQGLAYGDDGINIKYFGKNGKVNPLEVYDAYHSLIDNQYAGKEYEKAKKLVKELSTKLQKTPLTDKERPRIQKELTAANQQLLKLGFGEGSSPKKREEAARKKIQEDFGVTSIISKDQYDALKAIGYNGYSSLKKVPGSKQFSFSGSFIEPLNSASKSYTSYGVNSGDKPHVTEVVSANLSDWSTNGHGSGKAYKVKADGKRGDGISVGKIIDKLKDDKIWVDDIYFNYNNPTMALIRLNNGEKYYVNRLVVGGNTSEMFKELDYRYASSKKTDEDKQRYSMGLARTALMAINGENPGGPSSSKDAYGVPSNIR